MRKGRTVLQAKRFGIHSCGPNTSLVSAIRLMVDDEVSSLVVQDDAGCLMGLITRMEILQAHAEREDWASQVVADHMVTDVVAVSPNTMLMDATRLMLDRGIRQIVVVLDDNGSHRPVAMLTDADLAYHIVRGA